MPSFECEATIAPTASALKRHGGDGGFTVTFTASDDELAAYFALCVMTGQPIRLRGETITAPTYGTRDELGDNEGREHDDGSRDDDDERALAWVFGSDDDSTIDYENDAWEASHDD